MSKNSKLQRSQGEAISDYKNAYENAREEHGHSDKNQQKSNDITQDSRYENIEEERE